MARANAQPPSSVTWLIIAAGVAGAGLATYYGYPGLVAIWLGLVAAGWSEPRPVFTGPKDLLGAPTPLGVKETRSQVRYRALTDLRWRLIVPNGDWFPGVRGRAAFILALAAGALSTAVPVTEEMWTWANAAATFITITQVPASLRRTRNPVDPQPAMTLATLGQVRSLHSTLIGGFVAFGATTAGALALLGSSLSWVGEYLILPGIAYAGALGVLVAMIVTSPPWRSATLTTWQARVATRGQWQTHWQVVLGPKIAEPVLVEHRDLDGITVDTFDAPASLGAKGLIATKPKLATSLGSGLSLGLLSTPNLDSTGTPMPGTEHPVRVDVVTWPTEATPDVSDPSTPPQVVAYVTSTALSQAVDRFGGGGAQYVFVGIEAMHTQKEPSQVRTGWARLIPAKASKGPPAPEPHEQVEPGEEGVSETDETSGAAGVSPRAVWALAYTGDNLLSYVRTQYGAMMPDVLGAGVEVMVNHHVGVPGGDRVYAGAISDPETIYADPSLMPMLNNLVLEDQWDGRWKGVLKQGANFPEPQFATMRTEHLEPGRRSRRGTTMQTLAFTIKQGEQIDDFFTKHEPKLATTLSASPFVSITGYNQGGRDGDRHPQAFTVRWSEGEVPSSADQLPPPQRPYARGLTSPEHWVLAGQMNAAFDAARMARPEVFRATCMTSAKARGGHIWKVDVRLYGGVDLATVRRSMGKLTSSLAVPWIQVAPHSQPQCITIVLGADYRKTTLADADRDLPMLADLEWQQAWVDAKLVNTQGLTPSTIASATLETNDQVQVMDFELPSGITRSRIKGALEKLKGSTRNEFVEVRPGAHGASSTRLLISREDPMPLVANVRLDDLNTSARSTMVPFSTGVEGSTICWDLERDPHLLITGTTGSGKSAASVTLIGSLLRKGVQVVVADPTKDAADFRWAQPWLLAMTITVEETAAMMDAVYAEVQRRKRLNGEYAVANYTDLPEHVRPNHLVVYLDEFTSLIITEKLTKPAADDPEAAASYAANLARNALIAKIGDRTGRIVREARSAGVSLVLAAQELKSKTLDSVPGGETLRGQMSRLALGKMNYGNLMAALKQPDEAPPLGDVVPQGRGVFETNGNPTVAVQVWYDHPVDEFFTQVLTEHVEPPSEADKLDLEPFMPKAAEQAEGTVIDAAIEPEVVDLGEIELELDLDELDLGELEIDEPSATEDPGPVPVSEPVEPAPVTGVLITDNEALTGASARVLWAGDNLPPAGVQVLPVSDEPALLGHPVLDAIYAWTADNPDAEPLAWVSQLAAGTDDMGTALADALAAVIGDRAVLVTTSIEPDALEQFLAATPVTESPVDDFDFEVEPPSPAPVRIPKAPAADNLEDFDF